MSKSNWRHICALADIPLLGARRVQRAQGPDVALFRVEGDQVYALLDRCPHKGGPLSQGLVFGHAVACPLHGWTIALNSGQALAPDVGCAAHFEVRVEAGEVYLDQAQLDSQGLEFQPLRAGPCHA